MWILSLLFSCWACAGTQSQKNETHIDVEQQERAFPTVTVPSLITDPQERADYAIENYWNHFDFSDTVYVHLPEITEQAFSNYLGIIQYASPEIASSSIKRMLKQAEAEKVVYTCFTDMCEKYLYDPNSPFRNEELYIVVLEAMVNSSLLDEVSKIRPASLLDLALRNRLGEKTIDFVYTMGNGQTGRLYNIDSEYLLLYFYNPDCDACQELTGQLKQSLVLKNLQQFKRIKILAVYPDEDLTEWKAHLSDMPKDWILSYDATTKLKNEEIYDLKAIPCLYLLDKNKKVLLKDASFVQLTEYLSLVIK